MSSLLLKDASQVVTAPASPMRGRAMRDLLVMEHASVYIDEGVIKAVGPLRQIENRIDGSVTVLEMAGKCIMPGMVDSHTHLVFAGTREEEFGQKIAGATYQEIAAAGGGILKTVRDTRQASYEELISIALKYLKSALRHGTTTMEVKTGYGLDIETESKILDVVQALNQMQPVELIPTFIGAHAVPPGKTVAQYTQEVIAMLPLVAAKAEFCDVFCESGYFGLDETRAILEAARQHGLKLRLHANQFSNNGGVRLAVEMGALSVDHLEQISPEEIALLAQSDTCATLLPGVSLFLNYSYPPARQLLDQGCIVAVASDFNPGSCMCLNMQLIYSLACTQMRMTPAEAFTAVTANAAYAVDRPQLGVIAAGAQADLLVIDAPHYGMIPYFYGENHVNMVIKKGEIVAG